MCCTAVIVCHLSAAVCQYILVASCCTARPIHKTAKRKQVGDLAKWCSHLVLSFDPAAGESTISLPDAHQKAALCPTLPACASEQLISELLIVGGWVCLLPTPQENRPIHGSVLKSATRYKPSTITPLSYSHIYTAAIVFFGRFVFHEYSDLVEI